MPYQTVCPMQKDGFKHVHVHVHVQCGHLHNGNIMQNGIMNCRKVPQEPNRIVCSGEKAATLHSQQCLRAYPTLFPLTPKTLVIDKHQPA